MKILQCNFILICALIGISIFYSDCNNPDTDTNTSARIDSKYISELRNDSLIVAYSRVSKQLNLDLASNKINLSHFNTDLVKANRKNCHTAEQLVALYEKAGVTNAKLYVDLSWRIIGIVALLQKKYPELYMLPKDERKKIFAAVIPKTSVLPYLHKTITNQYKTKSN